MQPEPRTHKSSSIRIAEAAEVIENTQRDVNIGLVGGYCIGVDPYYLTHKAEAVGHHPEMILAGRRINDYMGAYIAGEVVKLLARNHQPIAGSRILILGLTFKENTPDIRNTQVIDVVRELESYNAQVDVHDPWVDPDNAHAEYGLTLIPAPESGTYDEIVLAVAHAEFTSVSAGGMRQWPVPQGLIYDVKAAFPITDTTARL